MQQMSITSDQAFAAMYFLLGEYFKKCKQIDDLGALLGTIDPFLWEEGTPIDPGTIYDWNNCVKKTSDKYTVNYLFSEEESYNIVIAYLKFYVTNYGFNFKDIIFDLTNNTIWKEKWPQCIEKALSTTN